MEKINEDGDKDCLYLLQQLVTANEFDLTHDLITVFEGHLTQFSDCFKNSFQKIG